MRHLTRLVTTIAAAAAAALAADPVALSSSAVCPSGYSSRRTWSAQDPSQTFTLAPATPTVLAYGYSSVGYYIEAWGGGGGSGYPGYGGDYTYGSGGGGAYVGGYFDLTSQPTAVLALIIGGAGGTASGAGTSPPCATGCSLPPSLSPSCGAGQGAGASVVALLAAPTSTAAAVLVVAAAGGNGGERGSGTGGAAVGATAALPDTYCEGNFCDFPGTGASPTGPGISGCRQGTPPYSQPCNTNSATTASGPLPLSLPYSSAGGLVVAATGGTCTSACCGNGGGGFYGGGGSYFHSGGGGGSSYINPGATLVSSTSGSGATAGNGARQFSQLSGAGSGSPDANSHGYPGTAGGIQITECVNSAGPSATPTPSVTSTATQTRSPAQVPSPTSTASVSKSPSQTPSQSQTPTPSPTPTASPSASPLLAPSATSVNFAISVPGGSLLSFVTAPSLGVQLRTACASLLGVANSSAFSILNLVSEPAGDTIAGSSVMNARRLQRRGLQPASVIVVTVSVDLTNAAVVSVFGSSPANFATALRLAFADSARVSSAFSAFAAAWAAATSSSPGATVAGLALVAIRLPNSIGAPAPASAASSAASASSVGLYAGAAVAAVVAIVAAVVLGLWIRGQMRLREEARLRMRAASKPSTTTLNPRLRVRAASKPITTTTTFNPSSPQTSIELPAPDLASAQAQPADLEIRLPNSDPASATFSGGRAMSAHTASSERGEDERQDFAPLHALRRDSESGRATPARAASPGRESLPTLVWEHIVPDMDFKPIATGTFGIVYKARYNRSAVAVKLLKKSGGMTDTVIAKVIADLVNEGALMARASNDRTNKNVITFHGMVEGAATQTWRVALDKFAYGPSVLFSPAEMASANKGSHMMGMVTEWEEGGDLAVRLYSAPALAPFTPIERLRLASEIAAGLYGLHRSSIVHADLKPANVLLSSANGRAALADFGLAKLKEADASSAGSSTMTGKDHAAGTWRYMAPELFRFNPKASCPRPKREKPARPRRSSDVYAFGVLAWELLSGKIPWDGVADTEHASNLYNDERLELELLPASTPRVVRELIARCLDFNPAARPAMEDVDLELAQAYTNETSGTWDVFLSYAWGKNMARRPFALAVYKGLVANGLKVWLDNHPDGGGQMGQHMQESMRTGIKASRVAVVLFSPDYADRFNCTFELNEIVAAGMPKVVVFVEPGFWNSWIKKDANGDIVADHDGEEVRAVPNNHAMVNQLGLRVGNSQLFVLLGDFAALDWNTADEDKVVAAALDAERSKLYKLPDALPLLVSLVKQAMAGGTAWRPAAGKSGGTGVRRA